MGRPGVGFAVGAGEEGRTVGSGDGIRVGTDDQLDGRGEVEIKCQKQRKDEIKFILQKIETKIYEKTKYI